MSLRTRLADRRYERERDRHDKTCPLGRTSFGQHHITNQRETPEVYKIGGGWGNAITWLSADNLKVSGFKPYILGGVGRPQIGDLLHTPLKSGKIGEYRFIAVHYCSDPDDMFFGVVEPVGYAEPDKRKDAARER